MSIVAAPGGTFRRHHYISTGMTTHHIDLSYLERLYKGDRSRIEQWIRLYLEEAPATFKQLADCMERSDSQALAAAAHDLRPYAHYLGAPHMLDLLIAIGQRLRTDGVAATAGLVKEVVAFSEGAEAELRTIIVQGGSAAKPV
jgi:HPt (histidine-containing phosphotransfer) domain-containing protein